jgi:hypothetical protein
MMARMAVLLEPLCVPEWFVMLGSDDTAAVDRLFSLIRNLALAPGLD